MVRNRSRSSKKRGNLSQSKDQPVESPSKKLKLPKELAPFNTPGAGDNGVIRTSRLRSKGRKNDVDVPDDPAVASPEEKKQEADATKNGSIEKEALKSEEKQSLDAVASPDEEEEETDGTRNESIEKETLKSEEKQSSDAVASPGEEEKEADGTRNESIEKETLKSEDKDNEDVVVSPNEEAEEADATKNESVEKEALKSVEKEDDAREQGRSPSGEENEDNEVWDIVRVIPTAEEKLVCRSEHCSEKAVAIWATDRDPQDKWPLCEKCQLKDFGGWPEGIESIERSNVIANIAVTARSTTVNNDVTPTTETSTTYTMTLDCIEVPKGASPTPTKEEIVTAPDESEPSEEKYELFQIVPYEKLLSSPIKCSDEGCNLPACSIWTSTADPKKWYYCIDCQEKDFGGWPPSKELPCDYLSPDYLRVIAAKCSKKRKPTMPVFNSNCVTPNPTSKDTTGIPAAVSVERKKVSRAAVARHEKWQADARKLGVHRIIVKKNEAIKFIYDALHDAFCPMNIESIYLTLKKMIPLPVLKATLTDMSTDLRDDELSEASDDNDDEGIKEKESVGGKFIDLFAGSVFFKAGRSAASSVYYVVYNKMPELNSKKKRKLYEKVSNSKAECEQLTLILKQLGAKTTQLLTEPTNDELIGRLNDLENDVATLEKKVNDARALTVNESHKNKLKRRIQSMTGHYRKRKQLCCSFLCSLEEISDGTISKKKCLKGDGQIALDSDESANNAAIAYAKSKKFSKAKKAVLADENFVGVALDSQQMIKRIYINKE